MGRYIPYGNSLRSSSYVGNKSNAFSVSTEKPVIPLTETPKTTLTEPKNRSYITDCSIGSLDSSMVLNKLHDTLNISNTTTSMSQFRQLVNYYNRFKVPTVNDALAIGFPHVFFVRPDCNLLTSYGKALNSQFASKAEFNYVWKSSPEILKQLVGDCDISHDFALYLSNKAKSFSTSDEYIDSDTYGTTFTGNKISFGRNNIESKTAGDFSITYKDDRFLHIYQLHRLWVDYISMVYRGECMPKEIYIPNKIIDYATAVYYIITAEDGETIIFWSKYYGVFPTTIPSTQFSWGGELISNEATQYDIKYNYSLKEDFNPNSLIEFNINAKINSMGRKYAPMYDARLGHAGTTWVGTPYIELVTNNTDPDCPYTFKLRYTEK